MDRCWMVHVILWFIIIVKMRVSLSASTVSPTLCRSGNYTDNGECCDSCPPGEGALSLCRASNTQCSPCLQNRTYSPDWSTDRCRPCTECTSDEVTVRLCSLTENTSCRCKVGLFRRSAGVCSQCNVCPPGYGTIQPCTFLEDIKCKRCVPLKTYSDSVTRATMCKPCTKCRKGFIVVENCTAYSDTVCASPPSDDISPSSSKNGTVRPYYPPGISIVPLYCVLLAALVIGLLIYVVFKRWTIYQLKLNNAQKMVRSTTSSTDIEKNPENINGSPAVSSTTYTGPSSYAVATVPSAIDATTVYKELPSDRKERFIHQLNHMKSQNGHQWSALCGELNFSETDIVNFNKSLNSPGNELLHTWQSRDGNMATVDVLTKALRNIRREDLADIVRGGIHGL